VNIGKKMSRPKRKKKKKGKRVRKKIWARLFWAKGKKYVFYKVEIFDHFFWLEINLLKKI